MLCLRKHILLPRIKSAAKRSADSQNQKGYTMNIQLEERAILNMNCRKITAIHPLIPRPRNTVNIHLNNTRNLLLHFLPTTKQQVEDFHRRCDHKVMEPLLQIMDILRLHQDSTVGEEQVILLHL